MKSLKLALFAAAIVPCLCQAAPETPKAAAVSGNTAFSFDVYAQLRSKDGNLFLSPYSISTALAMTYGGARGDTATQMGKALHFDLSQEELPLAFAALQSGLNDIQAKGKVKLSVANSLWPQKGYDFLPAYMELCKTRYGVSIAPLDFAKATEASRKTINDWVEEKTNKKITELFKPGVLDPLTRLVLVNAIYFKGDWANQFDKAQTRNESFSISATRKVDASMMNAQKKFRYAETPDLQIVELPYAGNDLSMVILLPRTVDGLPALERSLDVAHYVGWTSMLRPRDVVLTLPKFKATSEFSLKDTLSALGMTDAFNERKADFSGMNGRKDLFISAVVHKAFVDVNEEGTEAAAATGVAIALRSMPVREEPVIFRADHPFLFFIRENRSGSILFMGRIAEVAADGAKPVSAEIQPGNITWDEMVTIIKNNNLKSVFQAHNRTVSITTESGKTYHAVQPSIDLIFKVVRESGRPAPPMATE